MSKQPRLRAIFSDIDGTIVHYDAKLKKQGYELVKVIENANNQEPKKNSITSTPPTYDPRVHVWRHIATDTLIETIPVPSATLGGGYISLKTLSLVKEMREKHGVKYILITGARTSTFLSRVEAKSVPDFDFGVCEGGGKIYSFNKNKNELELDFDWLDSFSPSIGTCWKDHLLAAKSNKNENEENNNIFAVPICSDSKIAPEDRSPDAPIWELYRMLKTQKDLLGEGSGLPKLDAKSFDTGFMVDLRMNQQQQNQNQQTDGKSNVLVCGVAEVTQIEENLKKLIAEKFADSIHICINLGKAHISGKGCSKQDVTKYLAEKKIKPALPLYNTNTNVTVPFGQEEEIIAGMFDDENDLEFVRLCHVAFAPGVAHPSVNEFFATNKEAKEGRYQKCKHEGLLGTENALEMLLEKYCKSSA